MKKISSMVFNTLLLPSLLFGIDPNFTIHFPIFPITEMTHSIAYVWAHGLGATQAQAQTLVPNKIVYPPLAVFNFPDAKPGHMEYDPKYVNLGQQGDIDRLRFAYYKTRQELPDHEVVLMGVSRGAVTILNCIALHQLDEVRALVLESPFDTFNNVVKHLLRRFHIGWIPFSRKLAIRYVKKTFPSFDIHGIFPINVAHLIPLDLPIFIVHSRTDKTIPIKSSKILYCYLLQRGHQKVYFLELPTGNHGKLLTGPESDAHYALHAFYKRINLPYDDLLADRGESILKTCQPSLENMKKYVKKLKALKKKLQKNKVIQEIAAA